MTEDTSDLQLVCHQGHAESQAWSKWSSTSCSRVLAGQGWEKACPEHPGERLFSLQSKLGILVHSLSWATLSSCLEKLQQKELPRGSCVLICEVSAALGL